MGTEVEEVGRRSAESLPFSIENILREEFGNRNKEQERDDSLAQPVVQDPWPAWVYCTRYSDRPSSG